MIQGSEHWAQPHGSHDSDMHVGEGKVLCSGVANLGTALGLVEELLTLRSPICSLMCQTPSLMEDRRERAPVNPECWDSDTLVLCLHSASSAEAKINGSCGVILPICYGLDVKCSLHVSEHVVPGWWRYFGSGRECWEMGRRWHTRIAEGWALGFIGQPSFLSTPASWYTQMWASSLTLLLPQLRAFLATINYLLNPWAKKTLKLLLVRCLLQWWENNQYTINLSSYMCKLLTG